MSQYTDAGFTNRRAYLDDLADSLDIDRATVYTMAQLLGPSEDFDGLVTMLEDHAEQL
jgi:predicted transcriptional regulator